MANGFQPHLKGWLFIKPPRRYRPVEGPLDFELPQLVARLHGCGILVRGFTTATADHQRYSSETAKSNICDSQDLKRNDSAEKRSAPAT